ncbi:hypothetical protein, partial [Pseudomonas syringae]|uniref:hypothetical protein n=1 Tax=Pseudomonas syringae TaxID=317 RepID=UPI0019686591
NGRYRPLYAEVHSKICADCLFIYGKQIDRDLKQRHRAKKREIVRKRLRTCDDSFLCAAAF